MAARKATSKENIFTIGCLVKSDRNRLGYGKIKELDGEKCLVEYFYSVAKRKSGWVPVASLKRHILYPQTRCYVHYNGQWLIGRIGGCDERNYEVNFPEQKSYYVHESKIYVRCALPLEDPIEVLMQKGHETAFFHEHRSSFMNALIRQRVATHGMPGLVSSKIDFYPHQVEVARRVLEDPIQRYLLADEVGLGKTIEAGIIIRQFLLDNPSGRVLILTPPFLLVQWANELDEKFLLSEFPKIYLKSTDSINRLKDFNVDFLVIDEAHHVAAQAYSSNPQERENYSVYCDLAHRAGNLLLLSATPVLNNERDFLSMLHLLDPDNYRLDDLALFKEKIEKRQEIGRLLLYLREGTKPFVMKMSLKRLRELFAADRFISQMADELEVILACSDIEQNECDRVIRNIRLHISETYRLHRRMLRVRRSSLGEDVLISRYQKDGGSSQLIREYELDERAPDIYNLLEAWRETALAELARLAGDAGQALRKQDLQELFIILLEAAGSCPGELFKTINCRLGVTGEEKIPALARGKQLILRETPFLEGEEGLLTAMLKNISIPSEEGDRITLLEAVLEKYRGVRGKPYKKCVVFTSFPTVCEDIAVRLTKSFGKDAVAVHSAKMNANAAEDEAERFKSHQKCFVLVCDSSGEEGRNLQFAEVLIHFDVPWSPNRLEQRIGRLDRIGRKNPLSTHIFMGPDTENSLHEAWVRVLDEGFDIYKTSIASLQFYVDVKLPQITNLAFQEGAEGIIGAIAQMREEIQNEQVKIVEQNTLDEIDVLESGATQYFETLTAMEKDYKRIDADMDPWLTEALKFVRVPETRGLFKYMATRNTLVPANQLNSFPEDMLGTYCRSVATASAEGKLFRLGDTFIEDIVKYIHWDDRGKAFAIWRCQKGWSTAEGSEWLGFRFVYIIEADIRSMENLVKERKMERYDVRALKRRADAFFPPKFKTVYIDTDKRAIKDSDKELLAVLERPFKKIKDLGSDYNLTRERLPLLDQMIDRALWPEICKAVRNRSEEALRESALFQKECTIMAERTNKDVTERLEKLRLRLEREGSGLAVQKSLETEEVMGKALVEGVRNPLVRLDSVGFIAVSGRDPFRE